MKERFAITILAAGVGTRLKSRSAKVLHSVGGRTLIEHAVRTARELSEQAVFVIVGHQAEAVMEVLRGRAGNNSAANLRFIRQENPKGGTGDALRSGRKELESAAPHLLVICADTPLIRTDTLRHFMEFHLRSGAVASVMTANMEDPTRYGRMVRAPDGSVASIVEHKSASPEQLRICEINTSIYCFETGCLFPELERLRPDPITRELYLTDVIGSLTGKGMKVAGYLVADSSEAIGADTRAKLVEVDAALRQRKAQALLDNGVTIFRPESVVIDGDVEVGIDTVIEPAVSLLGHTKVGENCRIGSFSVITDSELGNDVAIKQSCVIEDSIIHQRSSVGPFSRLRPGSEIGPEAKIGNFVEIKKTRVGRGTRAQHLSYLGDAVIGENVNVGAGTITCNYDGEKKHPTVIEDNVFIGSGTELVAPVRVGRNAYVAAGSTITEEVPPDSLGVARGRQVNKPGWVAERKAKAGKKKPGG